MIFPFVGFLISLFFIQKFKKYENYNYIIWATLGLFFIPNIQSLEHQILNEYTPFITLISSLYILSSLLKLTFVFSPTPLYLMLFLAIGGILSNILGTTGASILLIHPLLNILKHRQHKKHIVLFFIFIVSNCGGCLTPLGDPPLYMGYLRGVDFFWPLLHLIKPYCFIMLFLLLAFLITDYRYYKKEEKKHQNFRLNIIGFPYLVVLAVTIALNFTGYHSFKIIVFLTLCFVGGRKINWHPVIEVAKVFLVLFITLIPLEHSLHLTVSLNPFQYFWISGLLSAVLDNAPTYIVFFKLASGNAKALMGPLSPFLKAISLGSVCMGALTYIGNAPNLMIKTIAEDAGIKMPSFLEYTTFALRIFLPLFLILSLIMFWA